MATIKDIAKKLGIAQDTFLRWCRDTKPQEMQVEEALMILREVSGRLDNEKDSDTIEAIESLDESQPITSPFDLKLSFCLRKGLYATTMINELTNGGCSQ